MEGEGGREEGGGEGGEVLTEKNNNMQTCLVYVALGQFHLRGPVYNTKRRERSAAFHVRAQELCESQGPYGLCGHKATFEEKHRVSF